MTTQTRPDVKLGVSAYLLAGIVIAVVQFALLAHDFPLAELFSSKLITTVDHAFHLYQILFSLDLAEHGKIVGYDPTFAAGYIGGVTFNASAKVPALAAWLLHDWLGAVVVYKLYVFLAALIAPVCLPIAARVLRLDRTSTWFASGFGLLLWWASAFHWDHTVGMVSYVLVSFLAIPYCAALYRAFLAKCGWGQAISLGLLGAGLFFLHPFSPVVVAIFVLVFHAFHFNQYSLKQAIPRLILIAIVSLLPNLIWLHAMLSAPSFADAATSPYQKIVDIRIILLEITGQWRAPGMGAKIYPLLALLAAWAAGRAAPEMRRLALMFFVMWIVLILFAALGAALPGMGSLQPNRFSAMGYLFLVVPAAIGADIVFQSIRSTSNIAGLAKLTLVVLFPVATLVGMEFAHEASDAQSGRYGKPPPEVHGLGASNEALLQWLKANTNDGGRVLFETSLARIHDGAHIAGLLARLSEREFIGGPYPYMFFAGFWDGHIFGKPIKEIESLKFQSYLDLYNVGWVAAHSTESLCYLRALPFLRELTQIGAVHIYLVDRPLSYFLAGKGAINTRVKNRVFALQGLTPGSPIVLKYHYVKGLHAIDASPLTPVYLGGDPQPFIQIVPRTESVEVVF